MKEKDKFNRLKDQNSPYLLQHAGNPVEWYPWGEEAFREAAERDRPVFLSIGYSTCHWCHVMAEESFQDREVAEMMNRVFISIKVDREERPDIDDIYMRVCQMLTGAGGWPLNIVMTPEKKPFFASTYIPREDRFGRVGMMTLIPRIEQAWKMRRDQLAGSAEKIVEALRESGIAGEGEAPGEELLRQAYRDISTEFDEEYGGFGTAPKFPTAHKLSFLLRYCKRTGEEQALRMVEKTALEMRAGGIFDQIGYGFHRYSTDRTWLLPHFEKMLYDQASLTMLYTDLYLATGKSVFRDTADEIIEYVMRDMRSPEGGFYSAEDADSEGEEGKFYTWSIDEIMEILEGEEAELAIELYNMKREGNFRDQSTGRRTGANILHLSALDQRAVGGAGPEGDRFRKLKRSIREKLLASRSERIRPGRDDKVLTDWNGMMIAALARAGASLGEEGYITAAAEAADFITGFMEDSPGHLLHRYRNGVAGIEGLIDDYAFMILGLLELHQATYGLDYLKKALEYCNVALEILWDSSTGGFFSAPFSRDDLIVRNKQIYDGAVPSGNSVMLMNLLRISRLTGNPVPEKKAEALLKAFSEMVRVSPSGYAGYLAGLDFALGPSYELVITGGRDLQDTAGMIEAVRRRYNPNMVVLLKPAGQGPEKGYRHQLQSIAEFTESFPASEKKASAYLCRDFSCRNPVHSPGEIMEMLDGGVEEGD